MPLPSIPFAKLYLEARGCWGDELAQDLQCYAARTSARSIGVPVLALVLTIPVSDFRNIYYICD